MVAKSLAKDSAREISYRPGTRFAEGTLNEPTQNLVRVFNANNENMIGRWAVDERVLIRDGKMITGPEIKDMLNLSETPTQLVKLSAPAGTDTN